MHPYRQHFFIMRAVEDVDLPALRQIFIDAPEEIVGELFGARHFERMHQAALRIDARHHVLDDAVCRRHPCPGAQSAPRIGHGRRDAPACLRGARRRRRGSRVLARCRSEAQKVSAGSKSASLNFSGLSIRQCLMILASFIANMCAHSWQKSLMSGHSCQGHSCHYSRHGLTKSPTIPATPLVWAGGCPGAASFAVTSSFVNPGANSVGARSVAISANV